MYIDEELRLTDNEIRYAVPEDLNRIVDIDRAINMAITDLRFEYGIDVTVKDDVKVDFTDNIISADKQCSDKSLFAESYAQLRAHAKT